MYEVVVGDPSAPRTYTVGEVEKDLLVRVFKDVIEVREIHLQDQYGSDNIVDDENSFKCAHGQSSQEGSL